MIMQAGQRGWGCGGDEAGQGVRTPHLFFGRSWCQWSSGGYGGRRWVLGSDTRVLIPAPRCIPLLSCPLPQPTCQVQCPHLEAQSVKSLV